MYRGKEGLTVRNEEKEVRESYGDGDGHHTATLLPCKGWQCAPHSHIHTLVFGVGSGSGGTQEGVVANMRRSGK